MADKKPRNVVVTGASKGIGYEIAKQFVLEGNNVIICARSLRNLECAQENLQKLSDAAQVYIKEIDVSLAKDALLLAKFAKKKLGRIDVLINNAGIIGPIGRFHDNDLAQWANTININLLGSVYITHAFIPILELSDRGKIVQLASSSATMPDPNFSAYACSKAGVVRFVETLAMELKSKRIDINAVLPGSFSTNMNDERINAGPEKCGHAAWHASVQRKKTINNSMENCIKLISFLSSDASNGLSGKIISAQMDNWENFKGAINNIQRSEKYTLRRII